jgi:hypothetical protein
MAQGKRGPVPLSDVVERIRAKTETRHCLIKDLDPCWIFTGSLLKGYGQIHVNGKTGYTHQVGFEFYRGERTAGLELDHVCKRPACWNPWHLEEVTHAENVRRSAWARHQAAKTHCPQGHEYTPENTYRPPGRPGRLCRICRRVQSLARYHAKKKL